jgi:aminoglycoside phosphotransferase (APT) family kinase protein
MELAEAIAAYFARRLADARDVCVRHLQRIPGGASRETWSVDVSWSDRGGEPQAKGFIIRRDPPASLVTSDRRVEFEFYRSFQNSAVPVPRALWLETEATHLERPFFVMERIDGCESQPQALLDPSLEPYRESLGRRMYEVLAAIATTPIDGLPAVGVLDVPAAGDCWRRELDYWEQVVDTNELEPQPIVRAGIRWLRRHPPPPAQRLSVVHGDYRTGNFLFRRDEIFGVLDWEMAHFGDPLEDLAWSFTKTWQWARDGKVGGVLDRADALAVWEERSGLRADPKALAWWGVFSCLKAQAIWLTAAREYADGKATELLIVFSACWLTNAQDRFLLEALGRMP